MLKCSQSLLSLRILPLTSVPFTLTTVQVPNLVLTHTKRITVWSENRCKQRVNKTMKKLSERIFLCGVFLTRNPEWLGNVLEGLATRPHSFIVSPLFPDSLIYYSIIGPPVRLLFVLAQMKKTNAFLPRIKEMYRKCRPAMRLSNHFYNLKPNSWTYNFVNVSGHNVESSQTWGFRMQCLYYTPFSIHFCSRGVGVKSFSRGDCEWQERLLSTIRSKNSASDEL